MALAPRDVPVTREDVDGWLKEYVDSGTTRSLKTYMASELNKLALPDVMVNTEHHDDLEAQTSILDMIMADVPSYGYEL
jgi:hypothetical protein